jgi:Putative metallopeptidase
MKWRLLRRRDAMPLLTVVLLLAAAPVRAQSPPPTQSLQAELEKFQARIDAAAVALGSYPKYKGLSPKYRSALAEFVAGNMLFVLVHEVAHAAIGEMRLPVLGKQEDAADSYAAVRLIAIGSGLTHRVLAEAAKGWFLSDRRDRKTGDKIDYYDEHGLDQQRAYQIVCFMVGSDPEKFKDLANETKLPAHRQQSCARDYGDASYAWDLVLKPHLRASDQPRTKIDTTYGESNGSVALAGQALRSIALLETVAQAVSDRLAWPSPIELELRTCGSPDAYWTDKTRKVTLCYEMAVDFADLYRAYGAEPAIDRKRTTARARHQHSSALR